MVETQFRVRYYETDAMGIVHHSNYIRWFEVSRTEYLHGIDMSYRAMEEAGIQVPVLDVRCRYHKPARYDDSVRIQVHMDEYTSTRVKFSYRIWRDEELLCDGETTHAFLKSGRPVALSRSVPAYHEAFQKACGSTGKGISN